MMIYKTLLISAIFLTLQEVNAQQVLKMSLKDATELAITSNWQVKKAEQNLGVATSELRLANSVFLPSINLSETYMTTNDPLSAFGFKLQQQVTSAEDFNPTLLNEPGSVDNFKTRLYAEQPIINMDGITARKAASTGIQASEFNLTWTKRLMVLQAKNLYFRLQLAYEQAKVLESSLGAATANYKVANDLFDQDLIHKADLLATELRLTEIESATIAAQNQIYDVNAELTHFLGLDQAVTIEPTDPISKVEIESAYLEISEVPQDRSDLRALSLQLKASNQLLKSQKGSMLPRLNAFGSYEWNDKSLFGTGADNYLVGAKLEWNIFKGGKNLANIQKATYQKNLAEIQYKEKVSGSQRDLSKVQARIALVKKQVDLSALAVEQAEETFKVRQNRFEEGLERTADVLQAESNLLTKRMNHLQTMNEFQQLVFKLEMLLEQELTL